MNNMIEFLYRIDKGPLVLVQASLDQDRLVVQCLQEGQDEFELCAHHKSTRLLTHAESIITAKIALTEWWFNKRAE